MNRTLACWLAAALLCNLYPGLQAQPVPVRHMQGALRGFLALRSQDGKVLALGDLAQTVRGSRVTTHLVFHFHDGSIDEETTVFSQRGSFRLISDHHIQQGPSYPHPLDLTIDVPQGLVTSRSKDKDGKEQVKQDHMKLPPDLANGLLSIVAENIQPQTPMIKVPMLVTTPKPRLITLAISPSGEDPFSVAGFARKAAGFQVKFDLGGVAGVVAPLIGKQPPDLHLWVLGGDPPLVLREQGPLFENGPIWTVELTSPVWPAQSQAGS